MKKIFALLITIILLLSACQPTPKTEVVVGKGEKQIKDMMGKAAPTQAIKEPDQEPELIELNYSAPEKLEYEIESSDIGATMKIRINADIILPHYTLPLIVVKPRDISYEQISVFLKKVSNGRDIYHSQYVERITLKKDIQHRIDTYMWEIAMCEGDPELKGLAKNYQKMIKELYKELEQAPETYTDAGIQPEESAPDMVFRDSDGTTWTEPAPSGAFVLTEDYIGPFEINQNNFNSTGYSLIIGEGYDADELRINADPFNDWYEMLSFRHRDYDGIRAKSIRSRPLEEIMEGFALSKEEAVDIADEYAREIDSSLVLTDISPAIYTDFSKDDNPQFPYGYTMFYSRQYCGVNTNYAEAFSYYVKLLEATGEMQMYQKPYPQEYLTITVGENGVQSLEYTSPLEVVEIISNNVEILPFKQIKEKFEQYIVYNQWNSESTIYMNINKIQLGLMRIAKPNSFEYLIVPVWDFYGNAILSSDRTEYTDDEYWEMISIFYNRSFLTINAVDGSVINREFGY